MMAASSLGVDVFAGGDDAAGREVAFDVGVPVVPLT
jgi:hypothetical protein